MKRMLMLLALLLAAGGPLAGQAAPARSAAEVDALTRQIAAELRCPVCVGQSVKDSQVGLSMEMKQVIRQQLSEGRSPDQVKQFFVNRYGEWILLEPEAKGVNLLVYLLPLAVLLGGGVFVAFLVRRWTRARPAPAGGEPLPQDALLLED